MEINRANDVTEMIRETVKDFKKYILQLEAIEKVCRNQPDAKVKKELDDFFLNLRPYI